MNTKTEGLDTMDNFSLPISMKIVNRENIFLYKTDISVSERCGYVSMSKPEVPKVKMSKKLLDPSDPS
jgi:hypothetical protein